MEQNKVKTHPLLLLETKPLSQISLLPDFLSYTEKLTLPRLVHSELLGESGLSAVIYGKTGAIGLGHLRIFLLGRMINIQRIILGQGARK